MEGFPDLPTFAEQGVPIDMLGWWAAFVPAATPRPIVDKLNAWFNQIQALPETKTFHNTYGSDPWIIDPGGRPGAAPAGHQELGRLRAHRQDRAAGVR